MLDILRCLCHNGGPVVRCTAGSTTHTRGQHAHSRTAMEHLPLERCGPNRALDTHRRLVVHGGPLPRVAQRATGHRATDLVRTLMFLSLRDLILSADVALVVYLLAELLDSFGRPEGVRPTSNSRS